MKIKKGWKITWISLGSLLGLVVVVLAVAMWLVFTPSKLTKIVNGLSDKFITCEARFGNVDLTLLSTFPDAGLRIDDVVIINPMAGGQSDTLAYIGSLTVGIDVKAFIKENKVIVHQVKLDDATANLYINHDGKSNFDIFPPSDKVEDTSSASLPQLIDLKKIKVCNLNARYLDEKRGMEASVANVDIALKGTMRYNDIDADIDFESQRIDLAKTDSTGATTLAAFMTNLNFDADGSMKGNDIEADIDLKWGNVEVTMHDPSGNSLLQTSLDDMGLNLDAKGTLAQMDGLLKMKVERGKLRMGENEMINATLQASDEELLAVEVPFRADLVNGEWSVENGKLKIDDYGLSASGTVLLTSAERPMTVDMALATDGSWQVEPLLAIVPDVYAGFKKGMEMDGKVSLEATAKGTVTDTTMPVVDACLTLSHGLFHAPSMLPYKIEKVAGDLAAHLDMGKKGRSSVKINRLKAHTRHTDLSISGRVDDLTGDMRVDANIVGSLPLEDVKPLLPEYMKLDATGDADLDIHANFRMSQLRQQAYDKMTATGMLKMKRVDLTYDTLHATAPWLDIAFRLPSQDFNGKMADAHIQSGKLNVENGKALKAELENAEIGVGVNNMMQQQLAAAFDIRVGETETVMDSTLMTLGGLKLKGSFRLDSAQSNPLLQYNPAFEASAHSAVLYGPSMPDAVRLSEFVVDYKPNHCDIKQVQVRMGHTDLSLYGTLRDLEDWIGHKAMLKGDLNLTSSYADVDQLMDLFSGMGSDKDSLERMRKEDSVPADAKPFIVPKDVDITLNTHIQRSVAFGNDLSDVAGSLTVKDGVAVLDQMGFVCKAATMQLTALYRSPRPNNLFVSLDFHLLDIQIHELLEMIPAVDTLVPMLSAFDGNGNFHLAGETYLNARYQPKMSSIMGAAAITGENLVVMDNASIANIARLMKFKSWKDKDDKIKIDSMSVELTCMDVGFGTEIEVLPFLLNIGSYQICASGVQSLGSDCSYHLELLKNPLIVKVGVDVKGTLSNPKISLGKIRYSDLFKPKKQGVAEKKALEIKSKVRKALEANVR